MYKLPLTIILNQKTALYSRLVGSFLLHKAAMKPLSCKVLAKAANIFSIYTLPQSAGVSKRINARPNKAPSNCIMPLLMPPQMSPRAVRSFREFSLITIPKVANITEFATIRTHNCPKMSTRRYFPFLARALLHFFLLPLRG